MKSIAEQIAQAAYGRSANVNDPKNANTDWRAGYAVGYDGTAESLDVIAQEWRDRGEPDATEAGFAEWKIGYWAGRFARIGARLAEALKPNT